MTCPGVVVTVVPLSTVGGAVSLDEEALVSTGCTLAHSITQHTVRRTGFADLSLHVQEVSWSTVEDTVSTQRHIRRHTLMTLTRPPALLTALITAQTVFSVSVEACRTMLSTDSILKDMSLHTLKTVCVQRTSTSITAPVTLCTCPGAGVEVVLVSTAVVLTLSKHQHFVRVPTRRAHSWSRAREALGVTLLTHSLSIIKVPSGAGRGTDTRGRQDEGGGT